ncbi:MAG TPA: GIY-YIG nuclease family protein [Candidatus Paceibacterota bacterium]|jgi:putative endonuclease|nr:GIY-YIG nuclease family protein [Candidatus Paceibacterota bacterium]HPT40185.1 GIY-YIG nuclease family protein [Candidatus Paceibacterota bacterium]
MSGYVYILKNEKGNFYIGSTDNLQRRIKQHNNGHTKTTKRMKNNILALSQEYPTLEMARKIERKIKKLKRKDYIEKMISDKFIKLT